MHGIPTFKKMRFLAAVPFLSCQWQLGQEKVCTSEIRLNSHGVTGIGKGTPSSYLLFLTRRRACKALKLAPPRPLPPRPLPPPAASCSAPAPSGPRPSSAPRRRPPRGAAPSPSAPAPRASTTSSTATPPPGSTPVAAPAAAAAAGKSAADATGVGEGRPTRWGPAAAAAASRPHLSAGGSRAEALKEMITITSTAQYDFVPVIPQNL